MEPGLAVAPLAADVIRIAPEIAIHNILLFIRTSPDNRTQLEQKCPASPSKKLGESETQKEKGVKRECKRLQVFPRARVSAGSATACQTHRRAVSEMTSARRVLNTIDIADFARDFRIFP